MNSIAFLMMLGIFAVLAYWYVRNMQAAQDGGLGPLALMDDPDLPGTETEAAPLSGAAAIRARVKAQHEDGATEAPAPADRSAPGTRKAYRLKDDRQA